MLSERVLRLLWVALVVLLEGFKVLHWDAVFL
jgi:hypothetical protein